MATVMIMGASGFFGGHIARKFFKEGFVVHLITTTNSRFSNLSDVLNSHPDKFKIHSIKELSGNDLVGIDYFIHTGIPYPHYTISWKKEWEHQKNELIRLLEVLKMSNVKKSVFVSVAATVGHKKEGQKNEDSPYQSPSNGTGLDMKNQVENIIFSYFKNGLPGVVVNPCLAFGAHDTKPSSGRFLLVLSKLPFYVFKDQIVNIVDVQNVADSIYQAIQKGNTGSRYLIGSKNVSVGELQDKVCEIVGKRKPFFTMPNQLTILYAYFTECLGKVLGQKNPIIPVLSLDIIRFGSKPDFNFEKMKDELGVVPSDPYVGVNQALGWFKEKKML